MPSKSFQAFHHTEGEWMIKDANHLCRVVQVTDDKLKHCHIAAPKCVSKSELET